jgi:peptidoglycan-N-acetylglucosamine deacetylase
LNTGRKEFFRRFTAAYLLAAPALALALIPFVPHPVIGSLLILHGLLLAPTFIPNSAWFGPVLRRFHTSEKQVLLTLDDGPDPEATPRVLALLRDYGAKACFFVVGEKVRAHPELARMIVADGHELANHTDSHRERWFWAELWRGVARETDPCSAAIRDATGRDARWFRAPVGMTNPFVHPIAYRRGLRLLGWSARAKDAGNGTRIAAASARVIAAVRSGAVIVLHPERKAPDGSHPGLLCLETVLQELRSMGYRCVLPADRDFFPTENP